MPPFLAPSADVSPEASIGEGTKVWHLAQIREGVVIGRSCIIGRGAYVDHGVEVGDRCKIQNHALVYAPARLEEGVFIGPAAILANDLFPRAITPDGELKGADDWTAEGVVVRRGASIGTAAVVLPGVEVGEWALVAAAAVVTADVLPFALVRGVPARRVGWAGRSGRPLRAEGDLLVDPVTGDRFRERGGRLEEAT